MLKSLSILNVWLFRAIFGPAESLIILENEQQFRWMDIVIERWLWSKLGDIDLDNVNFRQDGTTYHTSNVTIEIVWKQFSDRVISRRADHIYAPRPCNIFLWGNVKDKVFANHVASILNIKDGIHKIIEDKGSYFTIWLWKFSWKNIWTCRRGRASHMADVIFRY